MIPIERVGLKSQTMRTLSRRQARVDAHPDPSGFAVTNWRGFRGKARDEVLSALQSMCSGLERCMYCEDSQGTDVDHFRPKVDYPDWTYRWENYTLACSRCNSNHKRDLFPTRGDKALLIDPTRVDPFDHLALSITTGLYVGRDEVGRASIDVFGLNREICVRGRRMAWIALCSLIRDYEDASEDSRAEILETCRQFPFQGVRRWLAIVLSGGDRTQAVPSDVRAIVEANPVLTD